MVNFPTSLDTSTQLPQPSAGNFTNNPSHSGAHDAESQAIIALETKLGIGASTPIASKVLRGTGTGTSAFGSLVLTTDVTGTLPVANGGTGATVATGTGNPVLATSPAIVTPTLTSPTMTTPALGTPTSGVMTNVTGLPYLGLLSTIFSGQVLTQANAGTAGGTMYYINLGGIKLLWGNTASVGSGNWNITLPTGFFTTMQAGSVNATGNYINTNQMVANWSAPITGMTVAATFSTLIVTGATPSNPYTYLLIGT